MFNQPCIGEAILLNYTLRALEMAEAHGPTICVAPLYAAAGYTGGVAQVCGPTLCSLDLQFPTVVSREWHCIKWGRSLAAAYYKALHIPIVYPIVFNSCLNTTKSYCYQNIF